MKKSVEELAVGDLIMLPEPTEKIGVALWIAGDLSHGCFLCLDREVVDRSFAGDESGFEFVSHIEEEWSDAFLRKIGNVPKTSDYIPWDSADQYRVGEVIRFVLDEEDEGFGVVLRLLEPENKITLLFDDGSGGDLELPIEEEYGWRISGRMNEELINSFFNLLEVYGKKS